MIAPLSRMSIQAFVREQRARREAELDQYEAHCATFEQHRAEPRATVLPSAPRAPRPPGYGWVLTVALFVAVVIGMARLIVWGMP